MPLECLPHSLPSPADAVVAAAAPPMRLAYSVPTPPVPDAAAGDHLLTPLFCAFPTPADAVVAAAAPPAAAVPAETVGGGALAPVLRDAAGAVHAAVGGVRG